MEAMLYEKLADSRVQCHLCHHRCKIKPGRRGICRVRENQDGRLTTLVSDHIIAAQVDPIEKKPLFHVLPGSRSYSIATVGCNFRCRFCQNANIAQAPGRHDGQIPGDRCTPDQIVQSALAAGCRSISYTYTEPTVFFELAHAVATRAHQQNLYNVFVTNGYMTPAAVDTIAPVLDAANVDLKAFSDDFYRNYCGAGLSGVLETLKCMRQKGIWIEVTTLLIPGLNDDTDQLKALATFIATELGTHTPWHISRFFPRHQMTDRPPTPVDALYGARDIGEQAGLSYIYIGNVPQANGENTTCPDCGNIVANRWQYNVRTNLIENRLCAFCSAPIAGLWRPAAVK